MSDIRTLEKTAKALAHWRRIKILALLKKQKLAFVGDIAKDIKCTMPSVSQHIRILRNAGMILDQRRGKSVFYILSPDMSDVAQALIGHL